MVAAQTIEPAVTPPRAVFRRVRARARLDIAVEGLAVLAAAFALFALLSYAADRSLRLEVGYRLALLLLAVVVLGRVAYTRLLAPLGAALDDEELALAVERVDPGVQQALISALQFERALASLQAQVESRVLMSAVVDDVARRVPGLRLERAVDQRRERGFAGLLLASLAPVVAWLLLAPATAQLWAARNLLLSATEWPRATSLAFVGVERGSALRVPRGDDQALIVRASGVVPEQVRLRYRFAGGAEGAEPMTLTGDDEFAFTLQTVLEDVELWAEGGDGRTERLRLAVVDRPRLEDLAVALDHPEYMGKPSARVVATEGDVRVPRGGRLRLSARSTKPLQSASLLFGQEQRLPLAVGADQLELSGSFAPQDSGALSVHVVDADRLDSARPPKLFLRLVEDRAPKVEFHTEGIGAMITPQALIPGRFSAADDYGLRLADASFRVTGPAVPAGDDVASPSEAASDAAAPWQPAAVVGLDALVAGEAEFVADVSFDLRALAPDEDPASPRNRVRPGQLLSLRFAAVDNFGPGEPHRGESEPLVFTVVTRERLLTELSRRQQEQRRELETIVNEEKADAAELREIVSPAAADPRAARARERVLALSRKQRALGKRARSVGEHYGLILAELRNNRLFEPSQVAELEARITAPLQRLSAAEFPAAADAVQEFAAAGEDDRRRVAVAAYESIIQQLERVLDHMAETENLATLLEALRRVIKLEDSAIRDAERRRSEDAGSLFDPAPRTDDKKKPDDQSPEKKR